MAYRKRLERDLDRWIAAGHVPADKRADMLAMVEEPRRLDASTALAWIGAVMFGIAVIAFVAANWDGLPRLTRFIMVLALFAACVAGAAWTAQHNRPGASNALTTLAALVFAAAVGLVGQIFDIAGKPSHALIGSGVAAAMLALAGRSTGAALASLVLIGFGDAALGFDGKLVITLIAGLLAAIAAWSWKSAALAHGASLALFFAGAWTIGQLDEGSTGWFLVATVIAAGVAAFARWRWQSGDADVFSTFYGWFAWIALAYLVCAGVEGGVGADKIPHRLAWLAAAGGVITLGRHDRHALVSTGGVVFFIAAIAAILVDLGVDLITAAALFGLCALVALSGGYLLRRRAKA
ncbi:MAG: DUF2157 domain-containing protein [Alphaproteobacteria bacterium]|nr:DUF2157 domain-containing protein [Alphaproteobacteria bacterium]